MKIMMVLPTYNEADNLTRLLPALMALPLDLHVLVVDDNSPDGTGDIAENIAETYPERIRVEHREGKGGLGSAYIHGFKLALNEPDIDVIGQMDSDFSHAPQKLIEMAAEINDYDVIIGSRYVPGGAVDRHWPFWRKGLSAWASFYARTILGIPVNDLTGGFKLWNKSALGMLPLDRIRSNGYVFIIETAFLAHRLGLTQHEIPIYFADRQSGESKMDWRVALEAAWRVWTLRANYRDLHAQR